MSQLLPVSWREGLFLQPQHFQQAERSAAAATDLRLSARGGPGWGLLALSLDEVALAQGRLCVERCRAVLPDGLTVDIPRVDRPPAPRSIDLGAGGEVVEVYLAVPAQREGHPLVTADPTRADVRYVEERVEIPDCLQPARRQEILLAAKNLQLLFAGERPEAMVRIKIAEVRRGADGRPALVEDFIPPCAAIGASAHLLSLGRDVCGAVASRASSLAAERRARGGGPAALGASELESFWFLHTLNGHKAVLRHLVERPEVHPAALYEELLRLCGSLSTFELEEVEALPPYRHDGQTECFGALVRQIQALLKRVFVTRYEVIPLSRREQVWTGTISRGELLERGRFVLEVSGDLPGAELARQLPTLLKVATPDRILRAVSNALPGVGIIPLAHPPRLLPTSAQAAWFHLDTEDEEWGEITRAGQLSAYLPSWLPALRLKLYGIPEEGRGARRGGGAEPTVRGS